jgi:hypothetical protein
VENTFTSTPRRHRCPKAVGPWTAEDGSPKEAESDSHLLLLFLVPSFLASGFSAADSLPLRFSGPPFSPPAPLAVPRNGSCSFPDGPGYPPNPCRLLPGELDPLVSSELVPFTPPGKVRKKKSTIRPDGETPIFPMVTIPAFIPGPEWNAGIEASPAPTQAELVVWTPSRTIAAAATGPAGPQPKASSQFSRESAVREFIAGYRTPGPAQSLPSTPGLSVSSGEASEIISPTPRLTNKAHPAWIEPADHLQNIAGPFRAALLNRGISLGYGPATSVIERRDISDFAIVGKKRCHCSECVKCST